MMTACAGNNTIAALLAGAADAEAAQRLEVHLDACPACRQIVADLGRGLSAVGAGPVPENGAIGRLPRAGDRLGRYDVRRVIGVGGMGVVYEAHDSALDRRVALKLLRPDIVEDGAPQLLVEAKAMAKLQHPNIAVVHDVGLFEGQVYLCMEYVSGTTLRAWFAERPRSWRELLAVFGAAGRGLAFVHRAGLVHLDFKPDNVLVCDSDRVVVTDFGLARMIGGQRHTHGPRVVLGTPTYMAPEQKRGQATDARADQFGFCAAFQEALRGVDAPAWLRRALARGLAPLPADRFPSMEALLATFETGLRRPRRRVMLAVGTALAVTLAMLAARATTTVTRIVDRPVTRTVFSPGFFKANRAHETTSSVPEPSNTDPGAAASAPTFPVDRPRSGALVRGGLVLAMAAEPAGRDQAPQVLKARFDAPEASNAFPLESDRADESSGRRPGGSRCDDGSERSCPIPAPACPAGTILSVQDGCWSCADAATCAQLGLPRPCNDGTRLSCADAAPTCPPRQVAAVRDGCWNCQDAFACVSRSWAVPQQAPPPAAKCGNAACEAGDDPTICPVDCQTPPPRPVAPVCGNLKCEAGEDHASCPADCCETTATGTCVAVCGDGFCEVGEDHASCATDCCETTATGACAAVCGNYFCETGEDARSCPADCR